MKRKKRKEKKSGLDNPKKLPMPSKQDMSKRLREHVRNHVFSQDMADFKFTKIDTFTDKVIFCVNVFSSRVMLRVFCKCFSTLVVNVQGNRRTSAKLEF